MAAKALGKQGQWTNWKHLYYIFIVICGLDFEVNVFIYAPIFSFNEIKLVLQARLLNHPTA
jgi:hypothetical protein